jgi:hypothetical protein
MGPVWLLRFALLVRRRLEFCFLLGECRFRRAQEHPDCVVEALPFRLAGTCGAGDGFMGLLLK